MKIFGARLNACEIGDGQSGTKQFFGLPLPGINSPLLRTHLSPVLIQEALRHQGLSLAPYRQSVPFPLS